MTVGEMLARMGSDELTEWKALYQIKASERPDPDGSGASTTTFGG